MLYPLIICLGDTTVLPHYFLSDSRGSYSRRLSSQHYNYGSKHWPAVLNSFNFDYADFWCYDCWLCCSSAVGRWLHVFYPFDPIICRRMYSNSTSSSVYGVKMHHSHSCNCGTHWSDLPDLIVPSSSRGGHSHTRNTSSCDQGHK